VGFEGDEVDIIRAVTAIGYYLHLLALPFVQKLSLPHHMIAAMFAGFLIYSAQYTEADAVLRRAGASHLLFEVGITPVAKLGVRILHAMPFGAVGNEASCRHARHVAVTC